LRSPWPSHCSFQPPCYSPDKPSKYLYNLRVPSQTHVQQPQQHHQHAPLQSPHHQFSHHPSTHRLILHPLSPLETWFLPTTDLADVFLVPWRVSEADKIFEPAWDADHGAEMRERVEPVTAVVGTVAWGADAAERSVGSAGMHHDVVDGDAAGGGMGENWEKAISRDIIDRPGRIDMHLGITSKTLDLDKGVWNTEIKVDRLQGVWSRTYFHRFLSGRYWRCKDQAGGPCCSWSHRLCGNLLSWWAVEVRRSLRTSKNLKISVPFHTLSLSRMA